MKRIHQLMAMSALGLLLVLPARSTPQGAGDDFAVTQTGQSVLIDVLGNDGGLGGDLRLLKAFKPAHGSAAIEDGRIRYTPAPGFEGSDSFRYMAQPAQSQPAQATVNVEVGQGGVSLRLVGRVVDEPIPFAKVTVSIGGFDFVSTADADGNYVLDIAALRGDAFVTLVATGTAPSAASVRFYSAVGEIVRLSSAAGSDGVLTRDENNQVNITNLSTAQYRLLAEANGGEPVDSDQELLPLTQSLDLDRLLELAAVIKLVVDDGVPLPAGVSDALALISDPVALASFEAALAPDQLALAVDAVAQDPNLTPGFHGGNVPASYAIVYAGAPGTIRTGMAAPGLFEFAGDGGSAGAATVVDDRLDSSMAWNWALDAGDILLTPVAPYTFPPFVAPIPGCNGPANVAETITSIRLHRLQDGAGVDFLEVGHELLRHYSDADPNDACAPPADDTRLQLTKLLAFEDGNGELPFAGNESFGRIALNVRAPVPAVQNGAAIFDFDTHTVALPNVLPGFSHEIVNGRLRIHVTQDTGAALEYEYRRLQQDGSKGEGVLAVLTLPDGNRWATYGLSSRVDGSAALAVASLPGLWRSGFDISRFQGDGTVPFGFYLVLNADQTGNQRNIDAAGNVGNDTPFAWNVEAGNFIARTYRAPGYGAKTSCEGYSNCFLQRVRSWTPLSASGNRVYVLEQIDTRQAASDPLVSIGLRVNFYELQP